MLEKKTLYMVALGVGGLAVLLHIIGIATSSWISFWGYHSGLWESCSFLGCESFSHVPGRMGGAPALCILGLLAALAGLVLLAVRLFVSSLPENRIVQHLPPCLLLAAGILGLVGVMLFCEGSACADFGGYSLGLAIVGSILYVVVAVLLAVLGKSSSVETA